MTFEESITEQIRMCAACPKMCRHVCPTFFAWRSDSPTPHGRALLLHQEILGIRELDNRGIEVLYQCLECSHCLTFCNPEIEGRRPVGLNEMADAIQKYHNPYSEPHESRNDWLQLNGASKGKTLFYFTGCTAAYREKEIASDTLELLQSLGFTVKVSKDEWCCGSPLLRTGDTEQGLDLAKHNVEMLNDIAADEIVVTCPGCYRVLSKDYPTLGFELKKPVKHISQVLVEQLDKLPEDESDEKVTYHDPCHLGRHCGVYDEPRRVIDKLSNSSLIEMERNRENAMCCGNGAGLRTLFPDKAKNIGAERIRQAKLTGASLLVTSCPFCKNMLDSQSEDNFKVLDLPEYALMVKRRRNINID